MNNEVGSQHDFHNSEYSQNWTNRHEPTTERKKLFSLVLQELQSEDSHDSPVLELGSGPGFLAEKILETCPSILYTGIDFSLPMIEIAKARLSRFSDRVRFLQLDLLNENWIKQIDCPMQSIVSTWALHDLGSRNSISSVYKMSFKILKNNGVILNGDFVKPEETKFLYEAGRITVTEHLSMLESSGFSSPECLYFFEKELEQPNSANNYALLKAIKN